jgi:hypothetical protein
MIGDLKAVSFLPPHLIHGLHSLAYRNTPDRKVYRWLKGVWKRNAGLWARRPRRRGLI